MMYRKHLIPNTCCRRLRFHKYWCSISKSFLFRSILRTENLKKIILAMYRDFTCQNTLKVTEAVNRDEPLLGFSFENGLKKGPEKWNQLEVAKWQPWWEVVETSKYVQCIVCVARSSQRNPLKLFLDRKRHDFKHYFVQIGKNYFIQNCVQNVQRQWCRGRGVNLRSEDCMFDSCLACQCVKVFNCTWELDQKMSYFQLE